MLDVHSVVIDIPCGYVALRFNMSEPLEVVSPGSWSYLSSLFPGNDGIIARATIAMQIVNIQNHPDYPMTAYAPEGDPREGLIFIWKPTDKLIEVCVFSAKQDTSVLKRALANTRIINRNSMLIYCNLSADIYRHVAEILGQFNAITDETIVACLPSDKAKDYIIEIYPGIRLATIGPEYAEEIDSTWPHRYSGSVDYFKTMLSLGSALGLLTEESHELVGWIFTTIRGDLHALHIKESYRRNGYAQLLIKIMSKKLADCGIDDILAYIITDNSSSMDLFQKSGFHFKNIVSWLSTGNMLDKKLNVY
ncbi:uncharacterized protein LOC143918927 [Arctopsyche grandis]|uniref:uncharacterized protein LOC143918927 n=1 Tax=Arctopsyche grandis TaxID=121162 RepID=UPI00406D63DD